MTSISFNPYVFASGGPVTFAASVGDFKYNEGSGTTIANAIGTASTDMTLTTGLTWGSGNYVFATTEDTTTPNGAFRTLDSFSCCLWLTPIAMSATNVDLTCVGGGASSSGANCDWYFKGSNTNVTAAISNSSNSQTTVTLGTPMDTSHLWLAVIRYLSVGAGTSELYIDTTTDGVTWNSANSTTAVLKKKSSSFEFRRSAGVSSTPVAINATYERQTLFGYKLTDAQRNQFWANGKDAATYS